MTTWLLPALGLVVVEHGDALRVSGRARGGCSVVAGVQGRCNGEEHVRSLAARPRHRQPAPRRRRRHAALQDVSPQC